MEPSKDKIKRGMFVTHLVGGPVMWVERALVAPFEGQPGIISCLWFNKLDVLQRAKFFDCEVTETPKPVTFTMPPGMYAMPSYPYIGNGFNSFPLNPTTGTAPNHPFGGVVCANQADGCSDPGTPQ